MKKNLYFLLRLLLFMAIPATSVKAQSTPHVDITVATLDKVALINDAKIYAVTANQAYYCDASLLTAESPSGAVDISTVAVMRTLNVDIANNRVYADLDAAFPLSCCVIVVRDASNKHYVLGNINRAELNAGCFKGSSLFVNDTCDTIANAYFNILGVQNVAISEDGTFFYSNLDQALSNCATNSTLVFLDTVDVNAQINLTRNIKINQVNKPVKVGTAVTNEPLFTLDGGVQVEWYGCGDNAAVIMPGSATGVDTLFTVAGGSKLQLRQFNGTAASTPVVVRGASSLDIANACRLNTLASVPVVTLFDAANATVAESVFGSAPYVAFGADATGALTIQDSIAANHSGAIDADAYFRAGGFRKYCRTLAIASANAPDTVYLERDLNGNDTLTAANVVDLNGHNINGTLFLANNTDTLFVTNSAATPGVINRIESVDGTTGTVVLSNLDSVGYVGVGSHRVTILSGRYTQIDPATGASVALIGGKFGQRYDGYLLPRGTISANTDADATSFPWIVTTGYLVHFKNYNALGNTYDSIALVNGNLIVPAPHRPSYVGSDTIFAGYWTDSVWTRPFDFLHDTIQKDTTLYARWFYPSTDPTSPYLNIYVLHMRQALSADGGGYTLVDTLHTLVATSTDPSGSTTFLPLSYYGFAPVESQIDSVVTDGDTIRFHYNRLSYNLTWHLNGGQVNGSTADIVETYEYDAPLVYPTPTREGFLLSTADGTNGWYSPNVHTMPAFDYDLYAIWVANSYPVTWNGDSVASYNGLPLNNVTATYVNDNGVTIAAILSAVGISGMPVGVGTYTLVASPTNPAYTLTNNLFQVRIAPAIVSAKDYHVATAKLADGTVTANVTDNGRPDTVFVNDDLSLITTAVYDSPTVGTGKTITATFALSGADVANYTLAATSKVITTNGAIVAPITFNSAVGDNGITVEASGYCADDASSIQYTILSGSPNRYDLVFDAAAHSEGFQDKYCEPITNTAAGLIDIDIPLTTLTGDYTATLTLYDFNYPQFKSPAIPVTFHVNLTKAIIRPIFPNVITIVDTSSLYNIDQSSIKWYHNDGVSVTYVGDGPYYQEPNPVLTGSYYATLTVNGMPTRTCEQDDVTTLIAESTYVATSVKTHPNPTADRVTVTIEHPTTFSHTLRVMNILGMTLLNTTFEGDSTEIDLSGYTNGAYTVSIDGTVVRVIKK